MLCGAVCNKHLNNESVLLCEIETLELHEKKPKRLLRGKGKKFGVGAADRGVWQRSGRG